MTAPDRAAAVVSRLIADNLIAAPFEDYPDPTYYASIVGAIAAAIREAQEATRERCATAIEGFKAAPLGNITYWGEGLASCIRALPLN
jgi:hypothetical protein